MLHDESEFFAPLLEHDSGFPHTSKQSHYSEFVPSHVEEELHHTAQLSPTARYDWYSQGYQHSPSAHPRSRLTTKSNTFAHQNSENFGNGDSSAGVPHQNSLQLPQRHGLATQQQGVKLGQKFQGGNYHSSSSHLSFPDNARNISISSHNRKQFPSSQTAGGGGAGEQGQVYQRSTSVRSGHHQQQRQHQHQQQLHGRWEANSRGWHSREGGVQETSSSRQHHMGNTTCNNAVNSNFEPSKDFLLSPLQLYAAIIKCNDFLDNVQSNRCDYCKSRNVHHTAERVLEFRKKAGKKAQRTWQWEQLSELGKAPKMPYVHCPRWNRCFSDWKRSVALAFRWIGSLDILQNPLLKALQQIELCESNVPTAKAAFLFTQDKGKGFANGGSSNNVGSTSSNNGGGGGKKCVSLMLPKLPSIFSCSRQEWLIAVRNLKKEISSVFREYAEINPENQYVLNGLRLLGSPEFSELLQRFSTPELRVVVESFTAFEKSNANNSEEDLIEEVKLVAAKMLKILEGKNSGDDEEEVRRRRR
jgi:hypothetical protein